MSVLKPVCAKCQLFFRPKKNGYSFLEGFPQGTKWKPYKLWVGDLWECPGCDTQIVIGCLNPVSEHFESDFQKMVEKFQPKIQVNDC